jgi:hypothetical protein
VTSQEPGNPSSADPDIPDTEVIVVSAASPVFVDSTGRRRRVLRRLSYAFGAICIVYGGLVTVSLAGGPVSPSAVLPLPNLDNNDGEQAEVRASPTPQPTSTLLLTEALPPRAATIRRPIENRAVAPKPAATRAAPARTPGPRPPTKPAATPTPTTTRPVESTVTPTPSTSPIPTPLPTDIKGVPVKPPAPAPPAVTAGASGDSTEEPETDGPDPADSDSTASDPADTDSAGTDSADFDSADLESSSPEPEASA